MAGRRIIYGGDGGGAPNTGTAGLHTRVSSSTTTTTEPIGSLFLSGSSTSFMGSRSMVSFEDVSGGKRSERPFFRSFDDDNNVDDEYDEYFHQPEKKKRLTVDQVRFLEKSFEIENKLEPERKVELAKDLGLQPRQVAIWFQNRRARWKTKQMEKDYDVLQASYNGLKADYEDLLKEKEKLNAEVLHLSDKLLLERKDSDQSDIDKPPKSPLQGGTPKSASEGEASENPAMGYKLEDITSAKSDVLDSDSPRYVDGSHSSLLEAGDASYVDQSELSQDEEDNLSKNYMLAPSLYVFPKTEDGDYPIPPTYSSYYGFPAEDQPIDFWSY